MNGFKITDNTGTLTLDATTEMLLKIGGATQARLAGSGNIGVGGSGSDGSVFLVKNDNTVYGALNYNGGNDTLNVDNGGSSISVGASGISMTPATGIVEIIGDSATPVYPTVKFTDPTTTNTVDWTMNDLGAGRPILTANGAYLIGPNRAANENFSIGYDNATGTNCAIGADSGITRISNGTTSLPTDYIQLEYDTSTSLGKAKIVQTEEVNIETPLLSFTGAGLESSTSSGSSGQHLVITLNGTVYKIKLENP